MPDRYSKAIVLGDACVDMTIKLPHFKDGRMENFENPSLAGGGTCANTAVALSKLDVDTAFMGTVGQDSFGRYLIDEFESMGIDREFVQVDPESDTVCCFAFLDDTGERHIWGWPKKRQSYTQLDLSKINLEKLKTASWLHASGMNYLADGPMREIMPYLFKVAFEAGVPTSLDLNTRSNTPEELDPEIKKAVLATVPYCTYFMGSAKDEFYSLYPCDDWRDSVRHFVAPGRTVIARSGSEGSWVFTPEGEEFAVPAYKVTAVNTTGAGDSFNAGFVAGILHGKNVRDAVRWGSAVAAYKVCHGGSRATPDLAGLKEFFGSYGEEA